MKKILITGTAGFIGFHLVERLIKEGSWGIVGLDNINDYYDIKLKYARLKETGIERKKIRQAENQSCNYPIIQSCKHPNYRFVKIDLTDKENIFKLFEQEYFDYVIHLAAQAGVRYSITNPDSYIQSNVIGFLNILEACRYNKVKHLFFASSSSVYGGNKKIPFSETDNVDQPISIYAATKKADELMAYTYSHLYCLNCTGLRFFTVYGPWGRPDMALFKFTKSILNDEPIEVYNYGNMVRDFTYIDDIIESISLLLHKSEKRNTTNRKHSMIYNIFNVGNSSPVKLKNFITTIESALGKKAKIRNKPLQPGDVVKTYSDVSKLKKIINYSPETPIKVGVKNFIDWYIKFYKE